MKAERTYDKKGKKKKKGGEEQPEKLTKEAYAKLPRLPRDKALEAHADAMARGARCDLCPLLGLRKGPVPSTVRPGSKLLVIGEAPGKNEVLQEENFVGQSGQILNRSLADGGVAREECSVVNSIACQPPEGYRAYEQRLKILHEAEVEKAKQEGREAPETYTTPTQCCAPRVRRDIEESGSKFVLAVGEMALRAVADYHGVEFGKAKPGKKRIASLKKTLGSPITMDDGTIVIPTYHPAFAMRSGSRHYMHVIKKFITRAAEIASRGYVDWKEPPFILSPTVDQVEATMALFRQHNAFVTVDIETDRGTREDKTFDPYSCRIRCIGMGAVIAGEEVVITVPIRYMSGDEWWVREDKIRVLAAVMEVLNYNEIGGHNFVSFDSQVLLRFGLILEQNRTRTLYDTILAHRDTIDCDLPHDLGFVAARYFEVPSWKGLASGDDKYYSDATDYDLHLYCGRDVLVTMRLRDVLLDEVYRYGTVAQFEEDLVLAPIFRDMGTHGFFIDEIERGRLSVLLNDEAFKRLMKLKELTKDPDFNPASTPQLRKFFFVTKKLMPVVNTKMEAWEDGEDPATSAPALTKMLSSQPIDKETREFIDTLFEYRAYTKLAGTYVDNLKVSPVDWKKFGIEVGTAPAVYGKTFVEYKRTRNKKTPPDTVTKQDLARIRYPKEYEAAFAPVPKGLTKEERKRATKERKFRIDELLDRIEKGEWKETLVLPERPAISQLHTTFKVHIISSGRVSTKPAVQTWPCTGKADMRKMAIAPPGHKMVGADLDQVELRLYAGISGDKILNEAFAKGLDPHSLNAASMFYKKRKEALMQTYEWIVGLPLEFALKYLQKAGKVVPNLGEIVEILNGNTQPADAQRMFKIPDDTWAILLEGYSKGNKEKKKLRGYAKVLCYLECIAEGTPVLTDRGEVPIEHVQPTDKVWDGVEWVSHDGVVFKGYKETIEYEGLRATPDHKVWLVNGAVCTFEEARRGGYRIASMSGTILPTSTTALPVSRVLPVYDLLNAGPRRRFTAAGRLVSNCYGGTSDKLFQFMSTARDKSTGALLFPDIRPEDVDEWHEAWHISHPETKQWQERCEKFAAESGYIGSPIGCMRKRFFPGGANKPGATFNHCVQCSSYPNRILTDKGYMQIGRLFETGTEGLKTLVKGEWVPFQVLHMGKAKISKLKTCNGRETEWSYNHKFRVATEESYEWAQLDGMKPGDRIAKLFPRALEFGEAVDLEDAYWIGYCIGNGCYSVNNWRVIVGDRWHAPLREQVARLLAWPLVQGLEVKLEWSKKNLETGQVENDLPPEEANFCVVTFYKSRERFEALELERAAGTDKRVPERIWRSNLEARKAFLKGYLQSDGYIKNPETDKGRACVLCNTPNIELLKELQLLADTVGIEATINGPFKADQQGHIAYRLLLPGNQVFNALGLGRKAIAKGGALAPRFEAVKLLERTSKEVRNAYEEAGYNGHSAQVIYSRIKTGASSATLMQLENMGVRPEYSLTEVISIEHTDCEEDVYTLSVEHQDHSYIAEGLVSKNSSAAQVANTALIKISRAIPHGSWSPFTGLISQCHDWIAVCVPDERVEEAIHIVQDSMTTKVFGIPITATAKASRSWAEQ